MLPQAFLYLLYISRMTINTVHDFISPSPHSPHSLEHDFEKHGIPATWAPSQPQKWGEESAKITFQTDPYRIALSPDGDLLAVAIGNEVELYDTFTLEHRKTLRGHMGHISGIEFHPDGQRFVSSSDVYAGNSETLVRLWNLTDELPKIDFPAVAEAASTTATEELVQRGAWSLEDVAIEKDHLRDDIEDALRASDIRRDLHMRRGGTFVGSIASFGSNPFSHDGNTLFYLSKRKTAVAWDIASGKEKFRMAHSDAIMWVGSSPNSKLIATSSWDRTVCLWNATTGELVHTLRGSHGQNWAARFSPDGKLIAAGSGDQLIYVWNVETGEIVQMLTGFRGWIRTLAFTPDGAYLVAGAAQGTVRVFDVGSGESVQYWQAKTTRIHPNEISNVQFTPDGSRLAFKTAKGGVVIYDAEQNIKWGYEEGSDQGQFFGSGDLKFSSDGGMVISADRDNSVRIWKQNST